MVDEARTTAASTRATSMRLRGLALAGLGLMAAAATVAAASPSPSSSASASESSSTLAVKVTGPSEARQGQTIKYAVQLTPADGKDYTNVAITVSTDKDWATEGLTVTCPTGGEAAAAGCTFKTLEDAATITATVASTTAKAGDKVIVTAGGKDDSGTIVNDSSDPTTITPKESHSPTPTPSTSSSPTPTASKSKAPTSSSKPTGTSTKNHDSGTDTGSNGPGGGSGGPGGSSGAGGSGGAGGSVNDQPHPTLAPGGSLSGMPPSLGPGSSLSATSLPSMSTSSAPTPLVAIPPTTSTSGSPSLPITLTGESRGTVHPLTRGVPLAAVGLVLFVVSGWRLLRRKIVRKVSE